jgi:hypothetical protein
MVELVLGDGGANDEAPPADHEDRKEAQEETAATATSPSDVHVPRES